MFFCEFFINRQILRSNLNVHSSLFFLLSERSFLYEQKQCTVTALPIRKSDKNHSKTFEKLISACCGFFLLFGRLEYYNLYPMLIEGAMPKE